ncbi:hypothetical protein AB0M28_26315 [Streptomyces sp. NPDC051940]|uniref:hypothetical protein n=1 Tax=Streptomyces sp. NPDC051940 TaxID=3155675 RepID=UPI00342C1F82
MSQSELEDEFAAGLRQTVTQVVPGQAPPDLVGRGLKRGKQLRRRRNAGIAVVAALAVGGVGMTTQLLLGGADGGTASPAAGGKPSGGSKTKTTPSTGDNPVQGNTISAEKFVALATAQLRSVDKLGADVEVTAPFSRGTETDEQGLAGAPFANLVYDDGGGKAMVSFSIGAAGGPGEMQCPDKALNRFDSCDVSKVPGGDLMLFKGYEYPDQRPGPRVWYANLITKDGANVMISAYNSPEEKGAENTRDEPSLTLSQLKTLALSSAWDSVIADVQAGQTDTAGKPGAVTEEETGVRQSAMLKAFVPLLPEGMNIIRAGQGQPGYVPIKLDDGHGVSLVEINVQQIEKSTAGKDEEHPTDGGKDRYADAQVLDDGTKVLIEQGPAEKGGDGVQRWVVDVLHPDGRRIVLAMSNTDAVYKDATRDDMPLTIDQLKEIALSGSWLKL